MLRSVTIIDSPNGIAIKLINAPINIIKGARINKGLSALEGIMSSFNNNFNASAIGCSKPHLPA